jgi:hypothetical protein
MSSKKLNKVQESFIIKALSFDANTKYFGNICSNDLNETYKNAKNNDYKWRNLYVKSFTDADIAGALVQKMNLNPVRWKDIADAYADTKSTKEMLHMVFWYKEKSGDDELRKNLQDAYSKGLLNLNGNVEINLNREAATFKNYWALRCMFNAFKKICAINVADFKDKKSTYRDEIILAMSKLFPKDIKPQDFGFTQVPDNFPPNLFTQWNWQKQI